MGWWNHGPDGSSLHPDATGLVWGDACANAIDEALSPGDGQDFYDRMTRALNRVAAEFNAAWGRNPTRQEIVAGVLFSMLPVREFAATLEDGPATPPEQVPGLLNVVPLADAAAAYLAREDADGD